MVRVDEAFPMRFEVVVVGYVSIRKGEMLHVVGVTEEVEVAVTGFRLAEKSLYGKGVAGHVYVGSGVFHIQFLHLYLPIGWCL